MLRQGRWAEQNFLGQNTDRKFSSGQMVHDQKPLLVTYQGEKVGDSAGVGIKLF